MTNSNRPFEGLTDAELRDAIRAEYQAIGFDEDAVAEVLAPYALRDLSAGPTSPANVLTWTAECLRQGVDRDRVARVLTDHQDLAPDHIEQILSPSN